ncbi:RICIN domain-containing protein [Streptomyces sp. NBC_01637]|uniref:RICIN domain-containing protein n=1 Tax=unclassified Streptomyces TaxID=2593676 RepID=UPI0038664549|nr:RICIN domain-containing protein [Streptomyces sp. NBC_01653]WTD37642.1 RICIN domain-containing protein [Streptomyces sp. NBC_01643]WTD93048.1 RICIN domain-containing protein [Streptomyces sp. NBC_01637]
MRIRSFLSLAASAVAVAALATPAQAADAADGVYFIRDVRSGACLAGGEGSLGARIEPCNPGTVWEVRNQGDGLAQIVEARGENRCLALSPIRIYPPVVWVDECGRQPDRWTVQGEVSEGPVDIALGRGELGHLTTEGHRVILSPDGSPRWILERLG